MNLRTLGAALVMSVGLPALATPVTAVLRLQSRVPMSQLAKDVTNPSSPRYHKYYTPEEIRNFAGPSQGEYEQMLTQLRSEGFQITQESATHLWIGVKADSSVFERTFATRLTVKGQKHHALVKPQIPQRLALLAGITGLDNTRHAVPKYSVRAAPKDGGPDSGIPQATIKQAYQLDQIYQQGLTGKGQHIAIATYMGFNIDEVKSFYEQSNLKPGPTVDQVEFNGTPDLDPNSAVETQLDAEFTGMIAPGASIHVFASAENSDAGETAMFTAILDDNRAQIVNYSWGSCETQLTPSHKEEMGAVFERAVAQGVNIMVASGDSGSDSCQDGGTVADWPAANDNVVAVGGTTFGQDGNGMAADTAWNGSGGGISAVWALPAWQQSLGSPYTSRSYPDISWNADPNTGQAMFASQGDGNPADWLIIGGTSMAAPQWSGFLALVGEARAKMHKNPVGYLNSIIYGFDSSMMSQSFTDVTSGANGAYSAGQGWDAVTGWGTPQGFNLLNTLSSN